MKFLIKLANVSEDEKPCRGCKPIIVKGQNGGVDVTRWSIEIKTIRQLYNLVKRVNNPIIMYEDKSLLIYEGWIE